MTPIHIVGKQERTGFKRDYRISRSYFNRSAGRGTIPGSSIKGTIRSFFEALTNSWTAEATEEHESKENIRRIGFTALKDSKGTLYYNSPKNSYNCGPAIPKRFHPAIVDEKVDLASFLFGVVVEGKNEDNAYRSRVIFEDIETETGETVRRCPTSGHSRHRLHGRPQTPDEQLVVF